MTTNSPTSAVSPAVAQPPAGFEPPTPPGSPGTRGPAAPCRVEGCATGADSGATKENDPAPFGKAGQGPDTRRRDLPMTENTLLREVDYAYEEAVLRLLWCCQAELQHCPQRVQAATTRAFQCMHDMHELGRIQRLDRDSQPCDGTDKAGWATARRQAIRHTWGVA